ncbi:HNH endonuclease [Pseudonocardia aurantiaca]|uniref:Phosphorothioated DNA-binding restriction endonuclease n=1 Tax=Pseudonocardia aurantiaca TaxID=75290 RepID=A0ABW4FQR0_9PSEU
MDEQWLTRVQQLRRWTRGGERAPHKPLLLLFMLGRLQRGLTGPVTFIDIEGPLAALLRDFGPARASYHPEFPFHHLTSDGLWVISDAAGKDARPLGTAAGRLRSAGAAGQVEAEFERALIADPVLLAAVVRALLDANFAPSLHEDLLARTGLALEVAETAAGPAGRRRDATFRDRILIAYECRCAICGYDGWIDGEVIGLDAAHVRWWAIGGPDSVDNGLALCALHHRLFDRGVLGLADDGTVMVSQLFVGRAPAAQAHVVSLAGAQLYSPQPGHPAVASTHRSWHSAQVFRGPARLAA